MISWSLLQIQSSNHSINNQHEDSIQAQRASQNLQTRPRDGESIRDFIKKHFGLEQHSYTLAFQDSDKDMITISSNEDLSMLKELEDTSKLIKICIQPTSEAVPSKEAEIELLKPQTQAQTQPQAEAQFQTLKEEEKVIEPTQEKQNNKHRWGHKKGEWHQRCHRGQNKQDKQHLSKGKSHQKHSSSSRRKLNIRRSKKIPGVFGIEGRQICLKNRPSNLPVFKQRNEQKQTPRKQTWKDLQTIKDLWRRTRSLQRIRGEEQDHIKKRADQQIRRGIWSQEGGSLSSHRRLQEQEIGKMVLTGSRALQGIRPGKHRSASQSSHADASLERTIAQGKIQRKKRRKCWKESKDKRHRLSKDKQRCDNSGQRSEKGRILQSLVDLFGTGNVKQFYKLIEQHFSEGEEAIIERCLAARSSA